ncbi:MAG: hypothetical protein HQK54_00570 [Oligoflexales bacterium]|nr:hypothetical protein [Oligoflexales bacterium]
MCFNMGWSVASAAVGLFSSGYMKKQGAPKSLYIPIGYFSTMEVLQALQYTVINQCENQFNIALTYLSYLHISFQPVMWLFFYSFFATEKQREIIMGPFARIAIICGILFLTRLYHNDNAPPNLGLSACTEGFFCAAQTCSIKGTYHVAWNLVLKKASFLAPDFFTYLLIFFIFPLTVGFWIIPLIFFILGPILVVVLFRDCLPNEIAAIWCLLAVPQFILVWWGYFKFKKSHMLPHK